MLISPRGALGVCPFPVRACLERSPCDALGVFINRPLIPPLTSHYFRGGSLRWAVPPISPTVLHTALTFQYIQLAVQNYREIQEDAMFLKITEDCSLDNNLHFELPSRQ